MEHKKIRTLKEWVAVENPGKIEMYETRFLVNEKVHILLLSNLSTMWRYSLFDAVAQTIPENIEAEHEIFDSGVFGANGFDDAVRKVKVATSAFLSGNKTNPNMQVIQEYLTKVKYGPVMNQRELKSMKRLFCERYLALDRFFMCPFTAKKRKLWSILRTACDHEDDIGEFLTWLRENNVELASS